jgi:hypothetical protein
MDAADKEYLKGMCEKLKQYGALATEAHVHGEHDKAEEFEQKQNEVLDEIYEHFGIGMR